MGRSLASEALKRGHFVTIVAGPVGIKLPREAKTLRVRTAKEMTDATLKELAGGYDVLISTAAIADYTPTKKPPGKIKSGIEGLAIELSCTRKLTYEARKSFPDLFIAAFKAECSVDRETLLSSARRKLEKEGLNLIAANDIGEYGFGSDVTDVTLINKKGAIAGPFKGSKDAIAKKIWEAIEKEKRD